MSYITNIFVSHCLYRIEGIFAVGTEAHGGYRAEQPAESRVTGAATGRASTRTNKEFLE